MLPQMIAKDDGILERNLIIGQEIINIRLASPFSYQKFEFPIAKTLQQRVTTRVDTKGHSQ